MYQGCEITSIIKDQVQGFAIFESGQRLFNTPEIFFLSFTLPGKDRDAGSSDATFMELYEHLIKMRKEMAYAAAA